MQILIVEDEAAAARQLQKLIQKLRPIYSIVGQTESVHTTVQWLQEHPAPHLILMDIELSDGRSFDIFTKVPVTSPIIFTTAYNEYAIQAFKVNSVDYLLKPIDEEELEQALKKWETYHAPAVAPPNSLTPASNAVPALPENLEKLLRSLQTPQRYRDRLMVKTHNGLKSIEVFQIAYIKALDKMIYIYMFDGQVYIQDASLEELENTLDPGIFFRINRKYISHIKALEKILTQSNGKIRVELQHCKDDDVFISQSRTIAFKEWLDK